MAKEAETPPRVRGKSTGNCAQGATMDFAIQNMTAGQLNAVIKRLGGEEGAKRFLRGEAEVVVVKHIIDCDADPFVPDGWKVEEHKKGSKFEWSQTKVKLHLDDAQVKGSIEGNKLREKLASESVLNANVLDYLLKNPHLIPEEWKGKYIFFWGTVYRDSGGGLCVRCLYWFDRQWYWDSYWLDYGWRSYDPALLAS